MYLRTFLVFAFLSVCEVVVSETLKEGDPGVCFLKIPVRKAVVTQVPKVKRCEKGSKECTWKEKKGLKNFKPARDRCCSKIKVVPENKIACCEGWEFDAGVCKPQCNPGCIDGKCIAPNVCYCEPPLILNSYKCELPICEPPCVNSHCIANDTCHCNTGLEPFNATHCVVKCDSGYINDPITLECVPKCDNPCINGTCTAPNTCTCNDGHILKDDKFTCAPNCTPSCVNGNCVAPNTCSCFDGYKAENSTNCTPKCDQPCNNGLCVKPNTCDCFPGHKTDETNKFNCLPICKPICVNASCVSPDTCSCLIGYEIAGNNWTCKPKCDDCQHGDCIAPNQCSCHDGYYNVNQTCKPHCHKICMNGHCAEPNKCSCKHGYQLDIKDPFLCVPTCQPNCVNANCVAPNKCACLSGYEPKDDFNCKPKCISCDHGECVAPDNCRCDGGYKKVEGSCSPICSDPCVNGRCSSPDTCSCKDGYEKNATRPSFCFKPCKGPCQFGSCTQHGECVCARGYELANDTCHLLPPVDCSSCEFSCRDGDCACIDGRHCTVPAGMEAEASTTSLAGFQLTWTVAAALVLLLLTLVVVVMHRLWRRRRQYEKKAADDCQGNKYNGSVVYTLPDTLLQTNTPEDPIEEADEADEMDIELRTNERLLAPPDIIKDNSDF